MVSTNCAQCASSQACWLAPHEESGRSLNVHLKSPRVGCRRKTNRHSASFVFLQCGAASSPDFSPACDYPEPNPSPSGSTSVQISRNGGSCPSPSGRRWPEGPDEGCFSSPHPALRATLSQRERDISGTGVQIENQMKTASPLLLQRNASGNLDKSALGEGGRRPGEGRQTLSHRERD